jgi:disulfide bond formation protein DsbB|tara:strand:+ start:5171 stop:5665 length:495 start_codon:yes stop_codon:yes gene_type:complete
MTLPPARIINWVLFVGCILLMSVALFFQHVLGLEPCILCITQRVMVISFGLLALIAALHNPGTAGIRVYGGLMTLTAMMGGAIAIRQLWLQSLPADQVPACGPSLEYLLDVFPLTEVLEKVLLGDGNCAEVLWTLFGISIPGWTLVAFVGLAGCSIGQILYPRP